MIEINSHLSINPAFVTTLYVDTRFYMNGSVSTLEITMADGKRHCVEHGHGVDVWALKDKIARAMQEDAQKGETT